MQRKSLNIVEIYIDKNDSPYCKIIHMQMNKKPFEIHTG